MAPSVRTIAPTIDPVNAYGVAAGNRLSLRETWDQMNRSRLDPIAPSSARQRSGRLHRQAGQIVVEYVLLLAISVGLAVFITKALVGRNPDDPGIITQVWSQLNQAIGADLADDSRP